MAFTDTRPSVSVLLIGLFQTKKVKILLWGYAEDELDSLHSNPYQLLCDPVATHLFQIILFWLSAEEADMWI